jgi:hypothetical protein
MKRLPFRWEDIDHSLVRLRLVDLSTEMNRLIKADESRIRFEQRGNLNTNAVPRLVLQMKQNRADEWAQKTYEIYCDVWHKQGNAKSAAFLRALFARILPVLRGRAGAIASEFARAQFTVRTAFPTALRQAHLQSLDLNMRRIEDRWQRRLETEAKECEHAERIAKLHPPTIANEETSQNETFSETFVQPDQKYATESGQSVGPPLTALNRTRPGPRPKRPESFLVCAGTLWRTAMSESGTRVSMTQLAQIASRA